MRQFYAQKSSLHFIKTAVRTFINMMIFSIRTVITKSTDFLGHCFIIRYDAAGIA